MTKPFHGPRATRLRRTSLIHHCWDCPSRCVLLLYTLASSWKNFKILYSETRVTCRRQTSWICVVLRENQQKIALIFAAQGNFIITSFLYTLFVFFIIVHCWRILHPFKLRFALFICIAEKQESAFQGSVRFESLTSQLCIGLPNFMFFKLILDFKYSLKGIRGFISKNSRKLSIVFLFVFLLPLQIEIKRYLWLMHLVQFFFFFFLNKFRWLNLCG